jgi:hypothetical protein
MRSGISNDALQLWHNIYPLDKLSNVNGTTSPQGQCTISGIAFNNILNTPILSLSNSVVLIVIDFRGENLGAI